MSASSPSSSSRSAGFTASVWVARIAILVGALVFLEQAPGTWVPKLFLAKPSAVGERLGEWMGFGDEDPILWDALRTTLLHAGIGLICGTVLALVIAFVVWRSTVLARSVEPLMAVIHNVPRITLIPLFVFWLGNGDAPINVYVIGTAFFPMFYNALQGWRAADRQVIDVLSIMGARPRHIFATYLLPQSREFILSGLLIAAPLTLVAAIVGEMLVGTGIGGMLSLYRVSFDADGLYTATVVASAVGVAINTAVGRVNRRHRTRMLETGGL